MVLAPRLRRWHRWHGVRDWALIVAMGSLILLAIGGLALFWSTRRRTITPGD